jgi:hypothetical protein
MESRIDEGGRCASARQAFVQNRTTYLLLGRWGHRPARQDDRLLLVNNEWIYKKKYRYNVLIFSLLIILGLAEY